MLTSRIADSVDCDLILVERGDPDFGDASEAGVTHAASVPCGATVGD
jgi:hypothetical protein